MIKYFGITILLSFLLCSASAQIHQAAKSMEYEKVESYLKSGISADTKDDAGRTPMHYAAMNNDKDLIGLLVVSADANINMTDNKGYTPLDHAVEKGSIEAAQKLLDYKANARLASKALNWIITSKDEDGLLVDFLRNGADANLAATKAIEADNAEMLAIILDNSSARANNQMFQKAVSLRRPFCAAELLGRGLDKDKAMEMVIQHKDEVMIEAVLGMNPTLEATNKALVFAVEQRNLNLAKKAIEKFNANPTKGMEAAVHNNHLQMVQYLLSKGADANDQMDEAAAEGKKALVELFLSESANADFGIEPAAKQDRIAVLQVLFDAGGDANIAMPIAIEKADVTMVNMCIAAREPADVYRSNYITVTCKNSNLEILNALLMAGADPNPGMPISIGKKDIELTRELVSAGAAVDKPEFLIKAAELNSNEIAQLLLENGANPNPAISIAISKNNTQLVEMLIAFGAQANKPEFLIESAQKKNTAIVNMLLNNGADPNPGMPVAVKLGDDRMISLLVQYGADATPPQFMATACGMGESNIVRILLDAGADPNNGVLEAVKYNKGGVLSELLNSGADGSKDIYLSASVKHNNPDLTRMLINAGGDPGNIVIPAIESDADKIVAVLVENGIDFSDPEILFTLVSKNYTKTAKVLVNAGYSTAEWWDDINGQNLLHLSIEKHMNAAMVNILISGGVDADQTNDNGDSPLHLAVYQGKTKKVKAATVVQALISAGADVNAENANGETVLKAAPIVRVITKPLKKAGAKN